MQRKDREVNVFNKKVKLLQGYNSVAEVATELKLSPRRIRKLVKDGRLIAVKIGNMWMITRESVAAFKAKPRRAGKPPEKK